MDVAGSSLSLAALGRFSESADLGVQWLRSASEVGLTPSRPILPGDGSAEAAYARTQLTRTLVLSHSTGNPVGTSPLEEAKKLLADEQVVSFSCTHRRLGNKKEERNMERDDTNIKFWTTPPFFLVG